jgi:ABC-type glycerol-3-phosphate transport system substrate-binding protein
MHPSRTVTRRHLLKTSAVAALGLVAAACGTAPTAPTAVPTKSGDTAKPTGGATAPATPAVATAGAAPTSATGGKKVKLSISHIGGGSLDGSEQSDRMKQLRANFPDIEIENRWMSYAAYVDKISLITSTGDLADLQFCNAFNDVPLMMENNLLMETGPLLEQYGKNILAATPKGAWDSTIYDGKQYAATHNIYDLNIWNLVYRKDWLDKLGMKVPQTLDEYTEVLKAFTFKDPKGTGRQDTYGRALFNSIKFDDDIFHAFDVATGHHAIGFWRERSGKLELDWAQPGMKEAWGWLRARWAEKVFNPDSVTQQITYKGQVWQAGTIGSQYGSWTGMDTDLLQIRKTDPKAELVAGPALKGPNGPGGFTGEGFPWVYVIPKKSQVAEHAVRILDWFFQPRQAARFTCDGELNYTLKGLNDKGWCQEYTPQEKAAMGAEWNDRVNRAQDIVAYGGLWLPLGGNALRPWLLDTMPADMKAHFEGVVKARYSPAALEGMDFAAKYVKTSQKKRPTKSEKQYWPGLQTRFLEVMTQVVAGTLALDQGWNDWLNYFQKNGGPVLTQEVNELK